MSAHGTWRLAPGLTLPPDVLADIVNICVKNSEYNFTSGGHGTLFVDVDEMFATPSGGAGTADALLGVAVQRIRALAEAGGYDLLAFVESSRGPVGALSARVPLSEGAGLPSIVVRPHKRLLTQAIKPFASLRDKRVLVVTDVATTGGGLSDAVRVLWRAGARQVGALALVDREDGAEELLGTVGIDFHFVLRPPARDAVAG